MAKTFWTLGIVFILCAGGSLSAHAEQVKCQVGQPGALTTVEVTYTHSPGSPAGFQMLTAILKTPSRPWGDNYYIKRKQKRGVVLYNDTVDEKRFSLAIQSRDVAGSGLVAETIIDKGTFFEQKISGLTCAISGAPNPPVAVCPTSNVVNAKLAYAAKYESADQVEWLLDFCGASVDALDRRGCTPLLSVSNLACGYRPNGTPGHPADPNSGDAPVLSSRDSLSLEDLLTVLLDRGATINAKDPVTGETALMNLVGYGNSSAAWLLVDRKASVDVQDIEGNTALMTAAARGNDILVKTVLDGKPNLTLKNKKGETAYVIADKAGYSYLLPLLEEKVNAQTVQGKDDGTCAPTMVHIFKGKAVEIVLKASAGEMFLLTAPDLGLELMAMPGESVSQTITPDKKGTFPFTCGVHGAEKQTKGSFMVM